MIKAIASFFLLLILAAGCQKNPADVLPDSDIELTDGLCLVAGDQVVLNHSDIDYYDFSARIIYLKQPASFSDVFGEYGVTAAYAGGEKIYDLSLHPGYSSSMSLGPFIWTDPTFYPDYTIAISHMWTYGERAAHLTDERDDPRIVEALEKYGQFRHGLQGEITSIQYNAPEDVEVQLKLTNRDAGNYYYLDPDRMGSGLFHYFTNGLSLVDLEEYAVYTNGTAHVQPDPWDSFDMDWMSLLEGGSSVTLTITYDHFDTVPPGNYSAFLTFPGLGHQVARGDLEQEDGRIWLGELLLAGEVVVE
jgi:hypothetical protein